jgi:hypothetical protein
MNLRVAADVSSRLEFGHFSLDSADVSPRMLHLAQRESAPTDVGAPDSEAVTNFIRLP